jgi:hypothetical protein
LDLERVEVAYTHEKDGAMYSLPEFLQKVARIPTLIEQCSGTLSIIVQRPYAHLERELCPVFEDQEDARVIVNRR